MEKLKYVLESQQFSRELLENDLFPLAARMEKVVKEKGFWSSIKYFFDRRALAGKEMVSFFYEPSTRTRMSFEAAMWKLGGKVVFSTENAKEFSSVAKGETIEDTVRIICGYRPNVIVLRTDKEGMAKKAAELSSASVINAGDGMGQHPTQAHTDIYTIYERKGGVSGTHMAICGDLINSRVVNSLAYLYAKFSNVKISFVSPEAAKVKEGIKNYLREQNVCFEEIYDLREVASGVDIIYSTRIQRERGGGVLWQYGPRSFWTINQEVLNLMKKDAIIMHPLPHLDEIAPEVDSDPRAVYFRQAENGLYIRMALLKMILR